MVCKKVVDKNKYLQYTFAILYSAWTGVTLRAYQKMSLNFFIWMSCRYVSKFMMVGLTNSYISKLVFPNTYLCRFSKPDHLISHAVAKYGLWSALINELLQPSLLAHYGVWMHGIMFSLANHALSHWTFSRTFRKPHPLSDPSERCDRVVVTTV